MKSSTIVVIVLVAVVGVLALGGLYFFSTKAKSVVQKAETGMNSQTAPINGQMDLNGYIPKNATIKILARKVNTSDFQVVADNLSAQDGVSFAYANAAAGQAYEMKAELVVGGNVTDSSASVTAVAPAGKVVLRVNSSNVPPVEAPKTATISGVFDLNGYIPPGSTITLSAMKVGGSAYQVVATGIAAKDQGSWSWNNAPDGQTSQLKGTLVSNGVNVTDSAAIIVTAPATNELLVVDSTAKPPAPQAVSISGTVTYNGTVPSNPTFSLGVRKSGTGGFANVVSGVAVSQGMAFKYGNAVPGQSYDVQGYLWSNGAPYSQSQILTVEAPAANETLTINAQLPPSAPSGGSINVSCGGQQNNLYQATVNFNTQNNLKNPQQYQVTIGTTSGGSDVYNSTVSPSNPNSSQALTTNYLFSKAVNYYAQYAYATCQGCGTFSSPAPPVAFNCQN